MWLCLKQLLYCTKYLIWLNTGSITYADLCCLPWTETWTEQYRKFCYLVHFSFSNYLLCWCWSELWLFFYLNYFGCEKFLFRHANVWFSLHDVLLWFIKSTLIDMKIFASKELHSYMYEQSARSFGIFWCSLDVSFVHCMEMHCFVFVI